MSSGTALPVEKIYGPFIFTVLLATTFYSVMCMQTFRYFIHYQNDHLFLKALVATVWVFLTLHEAMTISNTYKQLIGGLRNPLSYLDAHPELFFKPPLSALVAVPVQGFFAHRIYIFTRNSFIAPLLWFIAGMIQIVCTFLICAKGLHISNGTLQTVSYIQLSQNPFRLFQTLTIIASVSVDVLIAIAMTILLAREWRSPLLPKTSQMLQRLIVFAVNTGVWSAVFAIITLILVYALPSTSFNNITSTAVCEVYSNTLLANLNARDSFKNDQGTSGTDSFGFALSALPGPASSVKPFEESRKSASTQKVGIVPNGDVRKPSMEVALENV